MVVGQLTGYNTNFHNHLDALCIVHEYELTGCGHAPKCLLLNEQRSRFAFIGEHFATSNTAPAFTSDPFIKVDARVGVFYNQSIAGKATDADGDSLTFSKVSGPDWLAGKPRETIQGTLTVTDLTPVPNEWIVRVETVAGFDEAVLQIRVVP